MAGCRPLRLRGRFAAALTVSLLTSAGVARAQAPPPPLPPAGMPAPGLSDLYDGLPAPMVMTGPVTAPGPAYPPGYGAAPPMPRVEMGVLETIAESIFGDASAPGKWRPLSLGNFFSEGWLEPWAGGPAGRSGLTPRHGWLGAFEGVFYRLWLVDMIYQNNLNRPYGGNGYRGDAAIFIPFSRRFELFLNVPFVTANGTEDPTRGYRSDFGDISIAGSFLLSETESFTQLFTLGAIVPTGQTETGGDLMTIFPRYSFWSNPGGGAWVFRGGTGINVPLNKNDQRPDPVIEPGGGLVFGESTSQTSYNAALALGRYFTPHDVPFGDLVLYANCNLIVPLEDDNLPTYVGVGPGTRFHIANNFWFLHYWEFPLTGDKPYDYQMSTAIVKAY
ncbi:hypothetical protein ElP_26550 [Tautonia plasticadhaerens]|uniref:Uncharacterized protein n=1 Tax=Tautonia plasticadhaerens TaxID=2527974 RepID=A0A518H1P8_9BACT|nr:hypothetical protein ElP_26550 [Tautonia plasticadhaerens]